MRKISKLEHLQLPSVTGLEVLSTFVAFFEILTAAEVDYRTVLCALKVESCLEIERHGKLTTHIAFLR